MTQLDLGSRVRDYMLVDRIATSPIATTYRASAPQGDVALKLYPGAIAPSSTVLRDLHHLAVARVVDAGTLDDGGHFLATEWIDGTPLASMLDRRWSWDAIRRIVGAIGSGLGALHARGVVHRDLKPSDVIVTSRRTCAAVIVDASPALREHTSGHASGTSPYAAPERVGDLPIDGRADLYALGAIMFQLLTGDDPSARDVPRVASSLCTWLLAHDRDARLPNAHVLAVTIGAAASELGALCGATVDGRSPS